MIRPICLKAVLWSLVCLAGINVSSAGEPADTVFTNGNIFLGKVRNPWASAVAVDDGRFVYVGEDPSAFVGEGTVVVDLEGRTVVPGLIDGHTHPGWVSLSQHLLMLDEADSHEGLMAAVEKMVAENPERETLLGGYWPSGLYGVDGPRKEDLDRIESDRPIVLYDDWTHSVWANSAALEQAGVTRDTPHLVPGFSEYVKGEDGEPTGWVTESASVEFMNEFWGVNQAVEDMVLDYLEYFRDQGVTTILDAGNFGLDRDIYAAVSRLDKAGRLPVRYHGSYTLFKPNDYDHAVETLQKLGRDFNSENVRIDTLKVFYDGVMETRTAAMSFDYHDTPGNDGDILFGREAFHDLILELDLAGLNLHVHTVGDRAVKTVLNAVESARETLERPLAITVTLSHVEVVQDSDNVRFRPLDVYANFTPHWWTEGGRSWVEAGIGHAADAMQRAQPLINDGAVVTFSSDNTTVDEWQTERSSPWVGMQVGHNRQEIGSGVEDDFMPPLGERVQRDDLMFGYTTNAAMQLGRADELGSIAVGFRADLVVLNQDPFSVDRYEIHRTRPVAVIMNGEIVSGGL